MASPLVSIITPVYDRPLMLQTRSIPSVLRQEYTNWEMIIVGDGPVGDTIQPVINSFGDARIRYLEIPRPDYSNLSAIEFWHFASVDARNYGLSHSSGDIVAPLDDDDCFFPNHLHDCVSAIEQGADLVYGNVLQRNLETGQEYETYYPWNAQNEQLFLKRNIMYHSSVCYSGRFRYL